MILITPWNLSVGKLLEQVRNKKISFEATERVILSNLHADMAMSDSQRYPFALYLINNVQDIVVFRGLKVLNIGITICFPVAVINKACL